MEFPLGKCLFHYTTREAAFAHILPFHQLRMPSLEQMRDPLENKTWFLGGAGWVAQTSRNEPVKATELAHLQFNMLANEIRKRARLLALTVDADGYSPLASEFSRGWARPRMWENYGENHQGICLVFDADQLVQAIVASLRAQELLSPYHRPVEYTETGAHDLTLDLTGASGQISAQFVADYIERHHVELFFRKALDWQTEYEYRFVVTVPEGWGEVFVDWTGALKAVVVGERFPGWQRPAAHAACEHAAVPVKRLDWTMGRPVLAELPREGATNDDLDHLMTALDEAAIPPKQPPPADT
ncbi:MAG: DUF2971 domain-containing protein [Solirubrobacterales bacterium]